MFIQSGKWSSLILFLGRIKPIPPLRSHSLEQSNKDSGGNCNPYASSPVVIPNVDNSDVVNNECPSAAAAAAVPPSGYVLAGQMNLGAISVPALNSANLSEFSDSLTTEGILVSSSPKIV